MEEVRIQSSETMSCACQKAGKGSKDVSSPGRLVRWIAAGLAGLAAWAAVYMQLRPFSEFFAYDLLGLGQESRLGHAVQFFVYDTPKVLMLLALVVFGVGVIRSFFTPEAARRLLAGKRETAGNVFASLLGVVTPFCSCSAVPLFIGFVTAGVPLGVTFSFLIAAPMVNEVAVFLLWGLLGWKVALIYAGTGLALAMVAGWTIGRLGVERYVEDWVLQIRTDPGTDPDAAPTAKMYWEDRIKAGAHSVKEIVGKVWLYVVLGIAVGAGIHGYVPEEAMASIMGESAWWSVPVSVLIGVPMYSSAAGIVPVVEALLGKGAALGSVLAFMMSVIALSLPEMLILRKVLKVKLIVVFVGVLSLGILGVGFLFNIII